MDEQRLAEKPRRAAFQATRGEILTLGSLRESAQRARETGASGTESEIVVRETMT